MGTFLSANAKHLRGSRNSGAATEDMRAAQDRQEGVDDTFQPGILVGVRVSCPLLLSAQTWKGAWKSKRPSAPSLRVPIRWLRGRHGCRTSPPAIRREFSLRWCYRHCPEMHLRRGQTGRKGRASRHEHRPLFGVLDVPSGLGQCEIPDGRDFSIPQILQEIENLSPRRKGSRIQTLVFVDGLDEIKLFLVHVAIFCGNARFRSSTPRAAATIET